MSVSDQLMQQAWFNLLYVAVFIIVGVAISGIRQYNKSKKKCPNGHQYDSVNTYTYLFL